jgi:hypothetical protein
LPSFIIEELPKLVDVEYKLGRSFENGNIKFYNNHGIKALQFRKSVGHIDSMKKLQLKKK